MRYLIAALMLTTLMVPNVASAQSCRELKLACEMKDQLGERGRGNCKAFREQCQSGPSCAELRAACLHKEDLGERGRGNCKAYRSQCTSG